MGKGFTLSIYPWVYKGKFNKEHEWIEEFIEKKHLTPEEEEKLPAEELDMLLKERNSFPGLPIVNYTSQYGMGCIEGLKAFPQKDGSLKLFRPDENAKRMAKSMAGLKMPVYPEDLFINAVKTIVKNNKDMGYAPKYDSEWEKDDFHSGHSVYIRPFSYSEPAIGLGLSAYPWVIMISTPVGAYFQSGSNKTVTTDKIRAFPGGTGWIKCSANYVIPTLVKKEAEALGYMEAVFLDAAEKKYIEEGSSCNIFFLLKNGTLVTPQLRDTILPGINRMSVLQLAENMGIKTEERQISINEVMSDTEEAFVTGTAAGAEFIESITHKQKTSVFSNGKIGETTHTLQRKLKGIQYGAEDDIFNWMTDV